jgi:hypothetical protein
MEMEILLWCSVRQSSGEIRRGRIRPPLEAGECAPKRFTARAAIPCSSTFFLENDKTTLVIVLQ